METTLTKSQKKSIVRNYEENGIVYTLTVTLRYDDECGNGHNTFAMTGELRESGRTRLISCGCLHDDIKKVFPEFEHLIKWHLCSSDGPMYYVENTLFHAKSHGPNRCHIEFNDVKNGLSTSSVKYCDLEEGKRIVKSHPDLYTMRIDTKTEKIADYDAARNSAIWPEATDEELGNLALKMKLQQRLPALIEEFKSVIENLGFTY